MAHSTQLFSQRIHRGNCGRPSARARVSVVASAAASASDATATANVPSSPAQQCTAAAAAIKEAYLQGKTRQRIELELPLIGATDLDDWPGGIRQQFKAATPLVESILKAVKQIEGLEGKLTPEVWDDGDAVVAWSSESLLCVVFPTAGSLKRLKERMASKPPKLLLVVLPQWETTGTQIIDFGFGRGRDESRALMDSLEPSYWLKPLRIQGDQVRVLRAFPSQWQVHLVDMRNGSAPVIAQRPSRPSYREVEQILLDVPTSSSNMSLMDRLKSEWKFNQDSLNQRM